MTSKTIFKRILRFFTCSPPNRKLAAVRSNAQLSNTFLTASEKHDKVNISANNNNIQMLKYIKNKIADECTLNDGDERKWRLIHDDQINVTTRQTISEYKTKLMKTVETVLHHNNQIGDAFKTDLVLFIDIDNWGGFFKRLPENLPNNLDVWVFKGAKNNWTPKHAMCKELEKNDRIHVHTAGCEKNAADLKLIHKVVELDQMLSKQIAFLIVSGDMGFLNLIKQMKNSKRILGLVSPHEKMSSSHRNMEDGDNLLDIIKMFTYMGIVADSFQDITNNTWT